MLAAWRRGGGQQFTDWTVAVDKLDKIGRKAWSGNLNNVDLPLCELPSLVALRSGPVGGVGRIRHGDMKQGRRRRALRELVER